MKKLALCAFVLLLAATVAAGCGSDSKKKRKKKSGTTTEQTVSIELSNSGLKAPSSVKAGLTKITFKNTTKKPGGAQLVRVEGNQTAEEVGKAGGAWGEKGKPLPDWLKLEGGPGNTQPGKTGTVTQNLAPGKYYALDIDSNKSAPIQVIGSASGDEPSAGPTVEAVDYGFKASGLKTGKQTILFENTGKQPHFMVAAPIAAGKTIADVRKGVASEKQSGPPPIDEKSATDTSIVEGGGKQSVEIELKKKGKYALLCFIPDRQGGPPHVAKGMVSEATVE